MGCPTCVPDTDRSLDGIGIESFGQFANPPGPLAESD